MLKKSSFIAAVLIFFGVNLFAAKWAAPLSVNDVFAHETASVPGQTGFVGWTAKAYLKQATPPDLVLMGSSMMNSASFAADAYTMQKALDCVVYRQATTIEQDLGKRLGQSVTGFNWSLAGAVISDDYMISRTFFHGNMKPKLVILGLAPRDFIDNELECAGSTDAFRFLSNFVNVGKLADMALPNPFSRFEWAITNELALRRMGTRWQCALGTRPDSSLQAAKEAAKKEPSLQSLGSFQDVRPGQWMMVANMPDMFRDNTAEYQRRFRNPYPPGYAVQLEFFKQFLSGLQQSQVKVLIVGMPSLWPNRKLLPDSFWQDWRSKMAAMCRQHDAQWYDLTDSDKFGIGDFLDTVHMNARGGVKLLDLIAQHIASDRQMVATLRSDSQPAKMVAGSKIDPSF